MAEKPRAVILELEGSPKQEGIWAMVLWLQARGYQFFIITFKNGAVACEQAMRLRTRGPFKAVVMDANQFDTIEEALTVFDPVAALLKPGCAIVHYAGRTGQSETEVSNEFLAQNLP